MLKNNNSFTLIEMLVVVAIIGILSSVLLTALGPARDKAKDSRIAQEVRQVQLIAEALYDGDYDDLEELPALVVNNPDLKALADDIALTGGELHIIKSSSHGAKAYAAYSRLISKVGVEPDLQTQYYCVDSRGRALYLTEEPTGPSCEP